MYVDYYGFGIEPFRLSPDHRFCLNHTSFKRAQAYMQYALLRQEGFVVVTGPPGTGKTTLIGELLTDFQASDFAVARLVSARLQGDDLLRMVCYAFKIPVDGIRKAEMLQRLSAFVARCDQVNRRPLLIVDEAQGLSTGALEELRLLTNQQVDGRQLLQVFLVGQDELRDLLADPGLEQLRQRIVGTCHIEPLQPEQTIDYVRHRLKVAGWQGNPRFEKEVFPPMYRFSRGVPRLINHVCSRLLLHGSLEQKQVLGAEDIALVIAELRAEHLSPEQASNLIDLAAYDSSDFPSLESEPLRPAANEVQGPQPIGERIAERRPDTNAQVQKPSHNVPEQQAGDTEAVVVNQAPAAGSIEPPGLIAPFAPIDTVVRLQPEPTASKIESDPEPVPLPGRRDRRPGIAAPVWGLAASLLLTLLISAIVLVSIPHYQLGRIASQDTWRELGVSRVRTLLSEWSGGTWPLSTPVSGKQKAPPVRNRVEDIAHLSRPVPEPPSIPAVQAAARPEVPVAVPRQVDPVDEPAAALDQPMAPDSDSDGPDLRLVAPEHVVEEPVQASPVPALAGQAKTDVYPQTIAPLTADQPPQETIVGQIAFAFDSDEISPQYWQLLDELAAELTASRANRAQIIGFTDSSGHSAYNIDLSRRRAAAVADYLLAAGGHQEQLSIEGRGSIPLPDTNHEAAGLRTVRIYLSAGRAPNVQLLSYGGD